jgi:hypothetical protein
MDLSVILSLLAHFSGVFFLHTGSSGHTLPFSLRRVASERYADCGPAQACTSIGIGSLFRCGTRSHNYRVLFELFLSLSTCPDEPPKNKPSANDSSPPHSLRMANLHDVSLHAWSTRRGVQAEDSSNTHGSCPWLTLWTAWYPLWVTARTTYTRAATLIADVGGDQHRVPGVRG